MISILNYGFSIRIYNEVIIISRNLKNGIIIIIYRYCIFYKIFTIAKGRNKIVIYVQRNKTS